MVFQLWRNAATHAAPISLSLAVALAPVAVDAAPTTSFPDTQNYWGQPFIQALAERNIVTGYLDNTYRPEQTLKRDEFAAIIEQAFSQPAERQIPSGSSYSDIPVGYWASPAIEQAYEVGFMKGYPEGDFRPDQPVTKVEMLTSLARNLNLPPVSPQTIQAAVAPSSSLNVSQQPSQKRAQRPLLFPLAATALMQPLFKAPVKAPAPAARPAAQPPATQPPTAQAPAAATPLALADYYEDAAQIPPYAVEPVAETTAAGIVVNYPDRQLLSPTRPATRGEAAALIHQVLVYQNRIEPLPDDQAAVNYIVGR